MSLDIGQLATAMLNAALGVLKRQTPEIRAYAEGEFTKIARAIATIEQRAATGQITAAEATLHLQIQRGASLAALQTVLGLGELAAEQAINAGLAVIRDTVNAALPFKLL